MTVYIGVFKEPRGFIRVLQLVFAIFAFSTACSGGSDLTITDTFNNQTFYVSWSYPYHLRDTPITSLVSNRTTLTPFNDIKPSAQFFVFTGVTSMLLALAFLFVYIFMDIHYRNREIVPIADFVITLIWTFFWIVGSSAWAQGVTNIRTQTSFNYVSTFIQNCTSTGNCYQYTSGTYANITVSVIFGFLNFVLWLASVWFIYKETKFFKSRSAQQQPPLPYQNNFANIAPPNVQMPEPG